MCGATYIPAALTTKPKIHGVAEAGEAPPTEGRGGQRRSTREDPYVE